MGFYGDNFTNLKKFFYKVFFKGTTSTDESFPTEEQTLGNNYLDITPLHAYDNVNIESGNKWVQFSPIADNDDTSRNMGIKIYHAAAPEDVEAEFFTVENITEREEGSTEPLTNLYYGENLKTRSFTFDKAGHIVAAGETTFTLPQIDDELNENSKNPVTNRVISQNLLVNESFENIVDGARPIQTQAIADKFEDVTELYDALLGQQQEDITKLETDPSWALYPRLGVLREEFNQFKEDITGTEEGYTKPGYSIYIADPESEAVLFANGQFYKPLEGTEVFNDLRLQNQEKDEDGNIISFKLREGNVALGKYAHAEGEFTMALGRASHSQGQGTVAAGNYSHASGYAGFFRIDVIGIEENGTIIRYADYETDQSTPENPKYFSGEITYNCYIGYDKEIPENIKTSYPHNFVAISEFTKFEERAEDGADGIITVIPSIGINSVPEGTKFVLYQGMAKGDYSSTSGYKTFALGNYSNAQGVGTRAEGTLSHAEGRGSVAKEEGAHAEGRYTIAGGAWSHTEGYYNEANGIASHVEGGYVEENSQEYKNIASGISSHAEGVQNTAIGNYSHVEGKNNQSNGISSHAEGEKTISHGQNSHVEGYSTLGLGNTVHAEGITSVAYGEGSHAEGHSTHAGGAYSHAEGYGSNYYLIVKTITEDMERGTCTIVCKNGEEDNREILKNFGAVLVKNATYYPIIAFDPAAYSITLSLSQNVDIEGNIISYNPSGITVDENIRLCTNFASGLSAHSENYKTAAIGDYSHAEGFMTTSMGICSHSAGYRTIASGNRQTVVGQVNDPSNASAPFIIGGGNIQTSYTNDAGDKVELSVKDYITTEDNIFFVDWDGKIHANSTAIEGADYAEYFEWQDGNLKQEDRIGHFVTIVDGEYIKIASSKDKILGVISGNPSVVGDSQENRWQNKYLTDIYGRYIHEEISTILPNGATIIEKVRKLNPEYDSTKKYIPRSQRLEWDAVGLLGKIIVDDDGTCVPGGYCSCNDEGIATATADGYYVMKRLDDTHIQILFK